MIEFNQLAMTHAQGSDVMLNRVMTKDNIALAVVLETRDGAWVTPPPAEMGVPAQQSILVATAHIHWDPEFCDVKLIQVSKKSLNFLNIPKCSALKGFLMWPSLGELHSNSR